MTEQQAGWYPDPTMTGSQRYWDGSQWTEHVAPLTAQVAPPTVIVQAPKKSHGCLTAVLVVIVIGLVASIAIPVIFSMNARNHPAAPQATFTGRITHTRVDDPATLMVWFSVKNTSKTLTGKWSCDIFVTNSGGAYTGSDTFDATAPLRPGVTLIVHGPITVTGQGAAYITSGSATCSPALTP